MMENAILTRFMKKVKEDPVTFCWVWTASICQGYGKFSVKQVPIYAHRWAYEWFVGPLPEYVSTDPMRMELHHICGRKACVNPAHLQLTARGNHLDCHDHALHGSKGEASPQAKLTEDQVLEIRARSAFGDSRRELALRFSVDSSTISRIVRRVNWKHI
jgi:hypothetical protein